MTVAEKEALGVACWAVAGVDGVTVAAAAPKVAAMAERAATAATVDSVGWAERLAG